MPTPLPSLDSLRCFVAAARLLSFRAAATSVALTPAALGQRIKALEAELGAPLFVRTTRRVQLTEAGLRLLPRAEACLEAARACVSAVVTPAAPASLELVLGTRQELGLSWLVPQLDALEKRLPELSLHLYFGSGIDLLHRVRSLEIDAAVTSTRLVDPKLDALRLHREDYVFVGHRKLLAARPLRKPSDAKDHVLLDAGPELPLFRYFREAPQGRDQLPFRRVVMLGSIEAIRQRVARSAGVAVLPAYLVERELAAKTFVRLFPSVTLAHDHFRLVFRRDDARRAIYERLAEGLLATPLT
jgi:LysR family transcriptional regulator, glycine cleavage system transcriptional activator